MASHRAKTAVLVLFPDWREQFRMILCAFDFRKAACQVSGLKLRKCFANMTGSYLDKEASVCALSAWRFCGVKAAKDCAKI